MIGLIFQHGTCPVCRKDLNGIDSSLKDDYPNPVDLMDSSNFSPNLASGGQNADPYVDDDDDDDDEEDE